MVLSVSALYIRQAAREAAAAAEADAGQEEDDQWSPLAIAGLVMGAISITSTGAALLVLYCRRRDTGSNSRP